MTTPRNAIDWLIEINQLLLEVDSIQVHSPIHREIVKFLAQQNTSAPPLPLGCEVLVYGFNDTKPVVDQVPDAWVLVPKEPTEEMIVGLEEGVNSDECGNVWFNPEESYRAMIAAAPKPTGDV